MNIWWNNLLSNKTKSSIVSDLQAIHSMLMNGVDKYADAFCYRWNVCNECYKRYEITPGQIISMSLMLN